MTTGVETEPTTTIIDQGAPNTIAINRDLKYELAATVAQMFRKQSEKKMFNKEIDKEIDKLKQRAASVIFEIESGGTQLLMNFATQPADGAASIEEPVEEEEEEREH